jgi:type IV pilus assembly protein PilX
VRALVDEENTSGNWYFPQTQAVDTYNVPVINWTSMPEVVVGNYSVRYVVDRLCTSLPITDAVRQCLNKSVDELPSARWGDDPPDPNSARLFRITVRVVGPKDTQTFVQSMITRG